MPINKAQQLAFQLVSSELIRSPQAQKCILDVVLDFVLRVYLQAALVLQGMLTLVVGVRDSLPVVNQPMHEHNTNYSGMCISNVGFPAVSCSRV